jgi:hypothetical protein
MKYFNLNNKNKIIFKINSISICQDFINNTLTKTLLVSQPGGRIILCKFNNQPAANTSQLTSTSSSSSSLMELLNAPPPSTPHQQTNTQRRTQPTITTQQSTTSISTNLSQQSTTPNLPPPPPTTTTTTPITNKKNPSLLLEEILNLSSELSNQDPLNLSCLPTYLLTNITCHLSNQYAYLVTFNGDIFFINLANLVSKKSKIWYRSINNNVVNCFKADINVRISFYLMHHLVVFFFYRKTATTN